MKRISMVIFVVLGCAIVYAQTGNFYLNSDDLGDTSLARVETKDGSRIVLKDIRIENNKIFGFTTEDNEHSINTNEINILQTVRGHHGWIYGTIGATALGVTVELLTMEEKGTGLSKEYEVNWGATFLGWAAGFGLGFVAGKSIPKWRKVYEADEYGFYNSIPLRFYAGLQNRNLLAGLSYRF
jgi:hypothetical protein